MMSLQVSDSGIPHSATGNLSRKNSFTLLSFAEKTKNGFTPAWHFFPCFALAHFLPHFGSIFHYTVKS
jgi:hypothetical protein